jgi:hypothetical protein
MKGKAMTTAPIPSEGKLRQEDALDRRIKARDLADARRAERSAIVASRPRPVAAIPCGPNNKTWSGPAATGWVFVIADDLYASRKWLEDNSGLWRLLADEARIGDEVIVRNYSRSHKAICDVVLAERQLARVQLRLLQEFTDIAPASVVGSDLLGHATCWMGGLEPWAIRTPEGKMLPPRFREERDAISAINNLAPRSID